MLQTLGSMALAGTATSCRRFFAVELDITRSYTSAIVCASILVHVRCRGIYPTDSSVYRTARSWIRPRGNHDAIMGAMLMHGNRRPPGVSVLKTVVYCAHRTDVSGWSCNVFGAHRGGKRSFMATYSNLPLC